MTKEQIEELVQKMTLDEKIGMLHGSGFFHNDGVERFGVPPLITSDGPMGVRGEFYDSKWISLNYQDDLVTYLPCNSALASTFNRELAHEEGNVLGAEARGRGKDIILAPGVNLKRSPLCGRNFEYFSEDGYLTSELAIEFVKGVQENDVAACVKHFALNNQETERMGVDSEIDEEIFRDTYLEVFRRVLLEGGAGSVMGAYNRVYGDYCCENKFLLDTILREEWNYDGVVISDWGGVHDTEKAATAGCDLEMSVTDNFDEYCFAEPLKKMVHEKKIDESVIDMKVFRLLLLMDKLNMLSGKRQKGSYNTDEHHKAAAKIAAESLILLKNESHVLPLDPEKQCRILVVGDNAIRQHSLGGGSAEIKALYEINPLLGLKELLGGNTKIDYLSGYDADIAPDSTEINWQENSLEKVDVESNDQLKKVSEEKREEVLKALKENHYDSVIYVGGLNHVLDREGFDKPDMKLPYGQDELIKSILELRKDAVIVLISGSSVDMSSWIDKADTVLWSYYNGCEGGRALARTIFGDINPSGKLPETFYLNLNDCSAFSVGDFGRKDTVHYNEGYEIGYKYTDKHNIPVLFSFGHGLSYTSFSYNNEKIADNTLTLTVTNTGDREGAETVMIFGDNKKARVRELIAFEKVLLQPGESKEISFSVPSTHENAGTKRTH
ncbi:MAG: glycoside hydrolase family 3 C-terminal domain-containing protein [Oribacterium sp.]|nr:glycoside hydrolase family 3 C-terminal domain-containing protein [Oribacterium sp.]